jgi:hypothetical protein
VGACFSPNYYPDEEGFGKSEDEAASITVRALNKLGLPGPGRNDAKGLQNWRDKLLAGEKSKRARGWYDAPLAATEYPWWKPTESAAIQIFLDPKPSDYDLKLTF